MATLTPVKILIVEGPAGGGKSSIIHSLSTVFDEHFREGNRPVGLQRPRDYGADNKNGANLSILKDYNSLIGVLGPWRYDREHIYLVDRMIWSQYVYGAMRLHHYTIQDVARGIMTAFQSLEYVATDYMSRSNATNLGRYEERFVPYLQIATMFWLPPTEVIEARRKKAGREFPWEAYHERHMYQNFIRDVAPGYPHVVFENDAVNIEHILDMFKPRYGEILA